MNIQNMNLQEVSIKLMPYILEYFAGCELSDLDGGIFAESYSLGFDEVSHLVPEEHKCLFSESDFFNGASGL